MSSAAADLIVVVPTRGRPQNIARLIETWSDTAAGVADLFVVADEDDDSDYESVIDGAGDWLDFERVPRKRLGPTLNDIAPFVPHRLVGFMGDDHAPRSLHWDARIVESLDTPGVGITYGNDLLQGDRIPTAVFMRTMIPRRLGYLCPPGQIHLYLDDAWKAWGTGAGCLKYLPEVIIEHVHPIAGKAPWDERYAEVNAAHMDIADHKSFDSYVATQLPADVAAIREVMAQ